MAIVSTELKIVSDVFHLVADFLGPKYDETKKKGGDYVRQANEALHSRSRDVSNKASELQKAGSEKTEQAKQEAVKAKDETKKQASQ